MPLTALDFVDGGLNVRYRASEAPQELRIDVTVDPAPSEPVALDSMLVLVEAINHGAAGSNVFAPTTGLAEVIDGPLMPEQGLQPRHHWRLKIAGVAPRFLRNIVTELRRSGFDQLVRHMSIVGELPVDSSPLSANEASVRDWISKDVYVESWPTLPFAVTDSSASPSGADAMLRVVMADPITPPVRRDLEFLSLRWLNCIRNYPDVDGNDFLVNPHLNFPRFGQGRSEFSAFFANFRYVGAQASPVLRNLLARFHADVAPVITVEIIA